MESFYMPANLTPQYKAAEATYKQAQTVSEKIHALEEMYRTIPKHKGTEKLCSDIKQRLSKARKQLEQSSRSQTKGTSFHVAREGAAQIVLVGPPNSGKSSVLAGFTKAHTVVADYPFSTQKPLPGMLKWENLQFQLVDLPPLSGEFYEPWVPSLVRVSDMVLLVVGMDTVDQIDTVLNILTDYKISLVKSCEDADYHSRIVKIPAVIAATKTDLPDAEVTLELLNEMYGFLNLICLSGHNPGDASMLGRCIFETLHLIRVYTRAPGKEANMQQPVVLRKGSTLLDVTTEIHKDFADEMKYARVWGSGKFSGQKIQRDYVVEEGDIFEFKV
jgi:uncharacterized protein